MSARTHDDILQVAPAAEPEVIDAAYRRLAAKYHPDRNADPAANRLMGELNTAHEILGNPARRKEYDAQMRMENWLRIWAPLVNALLDDGLGSEQCVARLVKADEAAGAVAGVVELRQQEGIVPPAFTDKAAFASWGRWKRRIRRTGLIAGLAMAFFVVLVIHDTLFPSHNAPPGTRIDVGKGSLYYQDGVGRAEAEKFARYLADDGFNKDKMIFQLRKNGGRYEFRMMGFPSAVNDDYAPVFEKIGTEAAVRCFAGAPVDVHACDSRFKTLRIYPHVPAAIVVSEIRSAFLTRAVGQELTLTNVAESDLTDVEITITLCRRDGGRTVETRSWAGWKIKEAKSAPVLSHQYERIEIKGTARQDGKKVQIDKAAYFDWK